MATFVLVHGSFSGGWVWRAVADELRRLGHVVYTPTLSGLGDRAHLVNAGISLSTHIWDIANLLFYEDLRDVVLVGHSYAGMVITGVATVSPDRLAAVIYLDAYVPRGGDSWFDLQTREDAEAGRAEMAESGLRYPIPASALGIQDVTLARWVDERMTPQPRATYEEPCPGSEDDEAGGIPRAFIRCTEGPLAPRFESSVARAKASGWAMRELPCGHNAMLIIPKQVVDLLVELAPKP